MPSVGRSAHAGTHHGANGLTIKVAQTAGFCFGVKRAVEMAWKAVDESKTTVNASGSGDAESRRRAYDDRCR